MKIQTKIGKGKVVIYHERKLSKRERVRHPDGKVIVDVVTIHFGNKGVIGFHMNSDVCGT